MAHLPRNGRVPGRAALSLLLGLALQTAAPARADSGPWELQEHDEPIRVYTRPVDGSPYIAVKVTARIDAPIAQVSELMGDGDGCSQWRAMCKSSKVIEQPSERERWVYLVLDFPWPVSDRDLVVHTATIFDPESRTATVQLESDATRYPPADYVRAELSGKFILEAAGDAEVDFTYIMHTDPGGDLSPAMVNARAKRSAMEDVRRLLDLAQG